MFGLSQTSIARVLRKAEIALLSALKTMDEASIRWPTLEEQRLYAETVSNRHPYVQGRWGFVDGKDYHVSTPSSSDQQNAKYNGWLHTTLIAGILCFAADGTVCWGNHNVVGSWNDGEISRQLQDKLLDDDINLPNHGVVSDAAFPVSSALLNRIQTPLKEGELEKIPPAHRRDVQIRSDAITSIRQAAEWGMGAVENVYRRLLLRLPFDKHVRAQRLETIYRLYNYRVRSTGISQIRSYFFPTTN